MDRGGLIMGYQERINKKPVKQGINKYDIMRALITMAWYNGLEEDVLSWSELPCENVLNYRKIISCPFLIDKSQYDKEDLWQLIYIWGTLVLLFGEYGTSPRYGWITEVEDFRSFIKKMGEFLED